MTGNQAVDRRFRRWQRQVFAISWLSYASFYLCRVNLAVALPAIRSDLGWSRGTAGMIGSVFLWIYAVGQLVNGSLGERANTRWFVGVGMLASSVCAALFGISSWPLAMALIWGLNGWAQSMGWGAIMKTIAAWFDPRQRGRITALFSPCYVTGHLVAWAAGGWLTSKWGWRTAFWLPAAAVALMSGVWLAGIRSTPKAAGFPLSQQEKAAVHTTVRSILRSIWAEPRLRWAALTCVFAGMIKDGLNLWAPTFLVDALGIPLKSAALAASVLPLLGIVGTLLAAWLSEHLFSAREEPGIMALSLVIALLMLGFIVFGNSGSLWLPIVLLGMCGMAGSGINALLMVSLPLSFGKRGNVAAIAGFLDFASYVGGGISGFTVGQLLDRSGWNAVFLSWLAATLLAFACAAVLSTRTKASL